MKLPRYLVALAAVFGLAWNSAYSHHSASGIDQAAEVTVTGKVKEFRWGNPHCWIEMEVINEAGATEIWNFEMNPPSYLIRAGWTRSTVAPGDVVEVKARPFFDARPGGIFMSVTLSDGQTFLQR